VQPVRGADNLTTISADCLDNVGSLTSHNPIGLHGLLQDSFNFCYLLYLHAAVFLEKLTLKVISQFLWNLLYSQNLTAPIQNQLNSIYSFLVYFLLIFVQDI
jgi:hypothetical protein